MRIGVLGTGAVGRAIATRMLQLGHQVTMGSRSAASEPLAEWLAEAGEEAKGGTFAEAAAAAELVFNCTAGTASLAALEAAGAENLAGKTLVDVANPLDFSGGFPPTLSVCNETSLAEQIQAAFPETHVVKSLNTVNAAVMVDPGRVRGEHVVFVCGERRGGEGAGAGAAGGDRVAAGRGPRPRRPQRRPRHRDVPAPLAAALRPARDPGLQHRDRALAVAGDGDSGVAFASGAGRWLLAVAVGGSGMAFLDGTVVNVALPKIGEDFDAGTSALQWILNGYMLALASLILLGGSLGDRFGRRRVFVLGVSLFTAASLLCAVAPSVELLVVARLLQGVGGALLTPGSLAIIESSFRPADRARAIGAWSGLAGVATAFGPLLGGYLIGAISWRAIFVINLPIGIFVAWAASEARAREPRPGVGRPDRPAGRGAGRARPRRRRPTR